MLSSCLADDLFYLECDHDGTDDRRPQLSTAAPIMTFQRHSLLRSSPRCDTTLHLSRLSVYPLIIQSNQIVSRDGIGCSPIPPIQTDKATNALQYHSCCIA
ncbi:hypothetical protein H2248_000386 [Termitomyces sp. 'cryptogamus']|nr:hypothetical protein H2248_000386 [Termitomyces sp. 'cryptogamus']